MREIWKYPLEITGEQEIDVPLPADFLSVGERKGRLVLWALVDPSMKAVPRTVLTRRTGQPLPEPDAKLIGTVVMPSGTAWHVFDGEIRGRGR